MMVHKIVCVVDDPEIAEIHINLETEEVIFRRDGKFLSHFLRKCKIIYFDYNLSQVPKVEE